MAASYPSAVKTFTTKVTGDVFLDDHINDIQLEVTAIETELGINSGNLGSKLDENDQVILFHRVFS